MAAHPKRITNPSSDHILRTTDPHGSKWRCRVYTYIKKLGSWESDLAYSFLTYPCIIAQHISPHQLLLRLWVVKQCDGTAVIKSSSIRGQRAGKSGEPPCKGGAGSKWRNRWMSEKLIGSLEDLNRSRRDGLGGQLEFGLPSRAAGPLSYKILVWNRFDGMVLFVTSHCSYQKVRSIDASSSLRRILFHLLYKTLSSSTSSWGWTAKMLQPIPVFYYYFAPPSPHSQEITVSPLIPIGSNFTKLYN